MARTDQLTLKQQVRDALTETKGDRDLAAQKLGKSLRTLNRYIAEFDMYEELDELGLIRPQGPPRGARDGKPVPSNRQRAIVDHIKKHAGIIDYDTLAMEMYADDSYKAKMRLYSAVSEFQGKGIIANDGERWFVVAEK